MTESGDTDVIVCSSTRDRYAFGPACRFVWGELEWYASVAEVRRTAIQLIVCASYGDLIGELLMLGLDGENIGLMVGNMLSRSPMVAESRPKHGAPKGTLGSRHTVLVLPVGSSTAKAGGVQISRGGKVADMDTASALRLGRDWLEAAEASESDSLFGQVVERAGLLSEFDVDALFGYLADIRSGLAPVPPAKPEGGSDVES